MGRRGGIPTATANLIRLTGYLQSVAALAPDERLSPELVLVLPPELRARAIAALGDPVWPAPSRRPAEAPVRPLRAATPVRLPQPETRLRAAEPAALRQETWLRSFGTLVGVRLVQLGLIFAAVLIVTLVLSLVAQAVR